MHNSCGWVVTKKGRSVHNGRRKGWQAGGLLHQHPLSAPPCIHHTSLFAIRTLRNMYLFDTNTLLCKPSQYKLLRKYASLICIYLSVTLCIQLDLTLHEHLPPPIHTKPINAPVMLQSLLSSPLCILPLQYFGNQYSLPQNIPS